MATKESVSSTAAFAKLICSNILRQWATNSTLKNVCQHTFSEDRKQVDEMIDRYFEDALNEPEGSRSSCV